MAILALDEVRSHCRLEPGYPAEQLTPYIDAAQGYVVAHLNRAVFEDQKALTDAQDALAETLGEAYEAYVAAADAAALVENPAQRQAMMDLADKRFADVQLLAKRTMNGIVVDGTIRAAMLLTLGNLFANREADVVGVSVAALPTGVPELLRSYRMVQMP
ncbi:head-tail connector protein [Neopusillimonas aromaticivorans]|uniref:head-tail connector protein n=1 Tax=Neopusillimonas aromaticivorans TaxID=2979868 RepID=UPI002594FD46|nr:head-tail connector protein [Neopusillimonas aromaticivorans]WJJ94000.1 head-tail connector protein [Neopusillimonas aromaticivorans]